MKENTSTGATHPTPGVFLAVYLALVVFTLLSFGISRVSHGFALYASTLLAAAKSTLVASYFMNLKYDAPFLRWIFLFSVGLLLWFIVMLRPDFYVR